MISNLCQYSQSHFDLFLPLPDQVVIITQRNPVTVQKTNFLFNDLCHPFARKLSIFCKKTRVSARSSISYLLPKVYNC